MTALALLLFAGHAWAADFPSARLPTQAEATTRRAVEIFPDRLEVDVPRIYEVMRKSGCRLGRHQPSGDHGREPAWKQRCDSSWICPKSGVEKAIASLKTALPVTGDEGDEPLDQDLARLEAARARSLEAVSLLDSELEILSALPASCAVAATERDAHRELVGRIDKASDHTRVDLDIRLHRPSEQDTTRAEDICQREHYKVRSSSRAESDDAAVVTACGRQWPARSWSRYKRSSGVCEGKGPWEGFILVADAPGGLLSELTRRLIALPRSRITGHCAEPAAGSVSDICRRTLKGVSLGYDPVHREQAQKELQSLGDFKPVATKPSDDSAKDHVTALRRERAQLEEAGAPATRELVGKLLAQHGDDEGLAWMRVMTCSSVDPAAPVAPATAPPVDPTNLRF